MLKIEIQKLELSNYLIIKAAVETVEEEETPLAGLGDLGKRVWWAWIPGVSALVSSYDGYKKNKKKAEEKDTDEDNEEE